MSSDWYWYLYLVPAVILLVGANLGTLYIEKKDVTLKEFLAILIFAVIPVINIILAIGYIGWCIDNMSRADVMNRVIFKRK